MSYWKVEMHFLVLNSSYVEYTYIFSLVNYDYTHNFTKFILYIIYNIYICFSYLLIMKYFFSVDWGTSSLRVRFAGTKDNSIVILNEVANQYGCGHVYQSFKNKAENICREDYFLDFLRPYLLIPD